MKDYKQTAEELISKYNKGTARPEERMLVEQWFLLDLEKNTAVPGTERINVADERISANLAEYINRTQNRKVIRLWPRIAMAASRNKFGISRIAASAAAVAAITLGVWLYYTSSISGRHPDTSRYPELVSGSQDIAPGRNTATLTLADGKTIVLSDAKTGVVIGDKLAYNDGAEIPDQVRHDEVQTLTASTPRGGTYQVTLPDGSKVWLNADSKITFPSQFSGKERKILLSGEAYFEVAKLIRLSPSGGDGRRPERVSFIVESNGQQVEVLGTHFNVNAYADEGSIRTTLLEGKVMVDKPGKMDSDDPWSNPYPPAILQPGEQAVLTQNKMKIVKVDVNEAVAWKNGKFMFNDEPLESIMRMVSRWYDVDIEYRNIDPKKTFWGSISRFENVSKVLEKLELTGGVDFKIEGKKIIVSKGK